MKIQRHNLAIRFVHWLTAGSILALLLSGFMQMPLAKRYYINTIPGLEWTSDFLITLNIHYIGAMVLVFISMYYLTYLLISRRWDIIPRRGDFKESLQIFASMAGLAEEPDNDKYLAEQRLAFAFTAGSILILIVSGGVKIVKNLAGVFIPETVLLWATNIHNLFTALLLISILVHLLAFLMKDNRPLVASMFTGKIGVEYVKKRHSIWWDKVKPSTLDEEEENRDEVA